MMLSDLLYETYSAITVNKARTGLTILGIVIGIASVITMVAIGQGAQKSIEESIQSIGSNLIMIMPGAQRGTQVSSGRGSSENLTIEDANAIEKEIKQIKSVAPDVLRMYQVTTNGQNTRTQVVGTTPGYTSARNVEVAEGVFFTDGQVKTRSMVAVLGPTTHDDLFGENTNAIGKTIRINNINFKVIGVTKSKGGTGFTDQDDVIYVPISTAQQYLSGGKALSTISIEAVDQNSLIQVQEDITNLLLKRHNIKDPQQADFSTLNQADIVATASSITGTFTILLAAIASISLLVGGIGIMNMMLTTVTERTREIGLRKAIGAMRNDIGFQFLSESILLTFIGGGVGIFLGWLICLVVTSLLGISTSISLTSIILAFAVSSGIGIVFGYYPAQRAAKMNPIEALRYE